MVSSLSFNTAISANEVQIFRFKFFYQKTGVTGPYALGVGAITYLCSKEIYVMEHEFYNGLSLGLMAIFAVKKFGPALAKYADEGIDVSYCLGVAI